MFEAEAGSLTDEREASKELHRQIARKLVDAK